ncbi:hypothetical protein PPYR_09197 [Photinus pyralis]|uniref:2',5'-phosphodiesterase 12 n=1 Tax=Photinus pyralis TaxID=7054 RepID=A0A1Y1K9A4_PHOPY|nr:2',5'-phosphodiesterase 12-like [Photinus pyralis]KAB0798204.1 hypothetical protein PPYR_09197 [Photinus pyralis]
MFLSLFKLSNTYWNINIRNLHKYMFKMDKAYLRHVTETEQFQISFRYSDSNKVDRQFNFCRQLKEPVGTFLSRVTANVSKVINKKNKKKKTDNAQEEENTISASLLHNGTVVGDERTCHDLFNSHASDEIVLQLLDKEYLIVINSPWINSLSLPKSIMANFPVYPAKFEGDFIDKNLSEFNWYKSEDKINWELVGCGFMYLPRNEDIKHYLKMTCLPKNENATGPFVETVSETCVEASPGYCPFETRHQFTKDRLIGKEFRVVTYNILADLYTDSDFSRNTLFPYCPPYALSMDYRKQLIIKELLGYNADIICLQELDKKIFVNHIEPVFTAMDYSCTFQLKGGEVAEGLGCIYNNKRFRFLESKTMLYGELIDKDPLFGDIWQKISANPKLIERYTQRSTVLELTLLESLENEELLLVANTHLYFHPDADHIRLLQGAVAIRFIEDYMLKLQSQAKVRISLIFCGDFNSVPECGIYQLYTKGSVSEDFVDWGSNAEETVRGLNLTQRFNLESACGTPPYTNYTAGFFGCLDYIYYEKDNLSVTQVIPLPSHEEVMEHIALPSIVHPSDHIALVADLKWL